MKSEGVREGAAGSDVFLGVTGALVIALAAGLGVVSYVGATPTERGLEGAMGSLALAAVLAAPGALALMGLSSRSGLLVPAGLALLPLSFISLAGATLPLLIPAVMLFVAYGRRSAQPRRPRVPTTVTTLIVILLLVAAVIALFLNQDARTYVTPIESGGTSDIITLTESMLSLSFVASSLVTGWWLDSPQESPPRGLPGQAA